MMYLLDVVVYSNTERSNCCFIDVSFLFLVFLFYQNMPFIDLCAALAFWFTMTTWRPRKFPQSLSFMSALKFMRWTQSWTWICSIMDWVALGQDLDWIGWDDCDTVFFN